MRDWYVVFTKPSKEEVAEQQLQNQGYEAYLPRLTIQKRRRGKWQKVVEPLFPRYLFVNVDPDVKSVGPVRSTIGVIDFVRFGGEMKAISAEIVEGIRRQLGVLESEGGKALKAGDKVEITDGPFAGLQAIYSEPLGEKRAIILLDMLGKVNKVTVKKDDLASIE